MTTEAERLYAKRDLFALGNDYIKHTMHMTGEALHSKSDIAAELAVRDIQLREQAAEIERKDALLRQALEALNLNRIIAVPSGKDVTPRIQKEAIAAIKQHLEGTATISKLDMLRLKARAFDNLMKIMDGQHQQVNHYRRPKPTRMPPLGECPAEATMEVEDVYVYEWKIRVANHTDLKRLCLDNAKKALEKEEKDAGTFKLR